MKRRVGALAAGLAVLFAITPSTALGAGTGDGVARTMDVPTQSTLAAERSYQRWIGAKPRASQGISTQAIDAPYRYFYTPTHGQEKAYWCGPATVQIIDDYWGACTTQSQIADRLGTNADGTNFDVVDNVLTSCTGGNYVYAGPCSNEADIAQRIQYGLYVRKHPIAADVKVVASEWDNYVFSHSGHIVCVEAFDWRYMTVRLNDPYDESRWSPGGGATLGHKTYPRDQVIGGIYAHWRRAMVY